MKALNRIGALAIGALDAAELWLTDARLFAVIALLMLLASPFIYQHVMTSPAFAAMVNAA